MKKQLFLFCALFVLKLSAQTSISLSDPVTGGTYTPDAIVYPTTSANTNTKVVIDIKNVSASTKVYKVKRNDLSLNTGALAYFCFAGGCYSELVTTSPANLTLTAGQSASQMQGDYNMLTADLDEGQAVGESIIEYTFMNIADGKDVAKITIKYNYSGAVGLKEMSGNPNLFEVCPNPAGEKVFIRLKTPLLNETSLVMSNAMGQQVFQQSLLLNEGDADLDIDTDNLPSGIYFVTLTSGTVSSTKKIIIRQ